MVILSDAVAHLIQVMQRNELKQIDHATYDRIRRLQEHSPVRVREWLVLLSCARNNPRLEVKRDVAGKDSEVLIHLIEPVKVGR